MKRVAAAKQRLGPEYKNSLSLIILIGSAGRHLNGIFNQEKLPIDGVLLSKQLECLNPNICHFKY